MGGRALRIRGLARASLHAAALLALAGCGGGGGGHDDGAASLGLEVPDQLDVVAPTGTAGSADVGDDTTNSDYNTDEQRVHVYDPSLEAIRIVNTILCLTSQVRYADMVNLGDYLAQVDSDRCDAGEDPSQAGQSGSVATNLETWTVNSSRANRASPQIVKLWIPESDEDVAHGMILVQIRIETGVSAEHPFGQFHLDFACVDLAAPDLDHPIFFGSLETIDAQSGFVGFEFFEQRGDPTVDPGAGHGAEKVQATVRMASDRSEGAAHIVRNFRDHYGPIDSGLQTEEYLLAFNGQHLLRQVNGAPPVALSRGTTTDNVWRYNLYVNGGADDGARVELDSGFPFRTASGVYGYIGYHGYWVPEGVTLADGETLERVEFGDAATTAYTLDLAPGKLFRFTRNTLGLDQLAGIDFEWFDFTVQPPQQKLLRRQNGQFECVALFDPATGSWTDVAPPEVIDTAAIGFLGMYSRQLNGPCFFQHGESVMAYFSQEVVKGDDPLFAGGGPLDLYGYFQCLDAGILGSEADAGDVYLPPAPDVAHPWHFVFEQGDLTLYWDVNGDGSVLERAGLADGESISSGPNFWGMRSGPMVVSTAGFTDPGEIFAQSEFFVWETGDNPWNQLAALLDASGAYVHFDPPLEFAYTHTQANDRNGDAAHAGEHYILSYHGPGELHGLPYAPSDMNGDGMPDRYFPLVNLADGLVVGPTGTEYRVKAIDIEQTMAVDPAGAPELDLAAAAGLAVPDGSSYVPPDIGLPPPTVTDPPAVIAGELQGTLRTLQP